MKRLLRLSAIAAGALVLLLAGGWLWASSTTEEILARDIETHEVGFPVPFPLTPEELDAADVAPAEADRVARERAIERGRHLVESRYACTECHGADFGGGVMVDDPLLGRLLGPNLTTGEGGLPPDHPAAEWDRIVRHGVRADGRPAAMPSEDFQRMSDQELSDIIAYIRSLPPVDREVPPVRLGPLGKVLVATGQLPLSADRIASHDAPHAARPPAADVSVEFGRHLAGVCTGCHREDMAGGPIRGGDPSWPPATNLTPHASGLDTWTYDDFARAMHDGVRPDGSALAAPMTLILPYAQRMTEVELQALWRFLQSVPPVPSR